MSQTTDSPDSPSLCSQQFCLATAAIAGRRAVALLPLLFSCEDLKKKIIILNKNHHVLKVIISNTRTFNVVSFVVLS